MIWIYLQQSPFSCLMWSHSKHMSKCSLSEPDCPIKNVAESNFLSVLSVMISYLYSISLNKSRHMVLEGYKFWICFLLLHCKKRSASWCLDILAAWLLQEHKLEVGDEKSDRLWQGIKSVEMCFGQGWRIWYAGDERTSRRGNRGSWGCGAKSLDYLDIEGYWLDKQ